MVYSSGKTVRALCISDLLIENVADLSGFFDYYILKHLIGFFDYMLEHLIGFLSVKEIMSSLFCVKNRTLKWLLIKERKNTYLAFQQKRIITKIEMIINAAKTPRTIQRIVNELNSGKIK